MRKELLVILTFAALAGCTSPLIHYRHVFNFDQISGQPTISPDLYMVYEICSIQSPNKGKDFTFSLQKIRAGTSSVLGPDYFESAPQFSKSAFSQYYASSSPHQNLGFTDPLSSKAQVPVAAGTLVNTALRFVIRVKNVRDPSDPNWPYKAFAQLMYQRIPPEAAVRFARDTTKEPQGTYAKYTGNALGGTPVYGLDREPCQSPP